MASTAEKKRLAMEKLRRRRKGEAVSESESDSDDGRLFDEVDEDEYKSVVRGRVMNDDFIEDDDGGGYADDGRDDLGSQSERSDSDDERAKGKGKKKSRKSLKPATADEYRSSVANAKPQKKLKPAAAQRAYAPLGTHTPYGTLGRGMLAPQVSAQAADDFMANLLGNVTNASGAAPSAPHALPSATMAASTTRKRKPEYTAYDGNFSSFRQSSASKAAGRSSPSTGPSSDSIDPPSDDLPNHTVMVASDEQPPLWDEDEVALRSDGHTHKKMRNLSVVPDEAVKSKLPSKFEEAMEFDDDDELEIHQVNVSIARPAVRVNAAAVKVRPPPPTIAVKAEPLEMKLVEPPIKATGKPLLNHKSWMKVQEDLANVNAAEAIETTEESQSKYGKMKAQAQAKAVSEQEDIKPQINILRSDDSLPFYWMDYKEIDGILTLFGKVKEEDTGKFVSCAVEIGELERCMFLLPRSKVFRNGRPTDIVPSEDAIMDEFEEVQDRHGIKACSSKFVTRKYAFELPDVPAETRYLKIRCGFDEPQLPFTISGNTFSRIFGTQTTPFELLVVKNGIMGPCWLNLQNVELRAPKEAKTWCKVECSVSHPKDAKPFADDDDQAPSKSPTFTIMSLAIRTVYNHAQGRVEVVAASARFYENVDLDDPTPPSKIPCTIYTGVRPLGSRFPNGFENAAGKKAITPLKTEQSLLGNLLAQIRRFDPDVIVGHDFSNSAIEVLLRRMTDLKVSTWSFFGRWRGAKSPPKTSWAMSAVSGRLVADLTGDTGKSVISSTTWSLSEMASTHLSIGREEIDPDDTATFFDADAAGPERLLTFMAHCSTDTYLQMAIAAQVQMLPLSRQLTNLAGNCWSHTLNGGRAERNEYILLHEFHRNKYICPDKYNRKQMEEFTAHEAATAKQARAAAARAKGEELDQEAEVEIEKAAKNAKSTYQGGLVFEPKRGLYDKYILVMDFNSLYPSIIQEFNIDFTTVDRFAGSDANDPSAIPDVPVDQEQGVLPRLIAQLVSRRREVKKLIKDEQGKINRLRTDDAKREAEAKIAQWNIKQLALKLTANSMYGCLGFAGSRFYAMPLAALTTHKGREILTQTKELAQSLCLDVIYGDTDSVMINTMASELDDAKRIGEDFKKAVNDRYRLLEIDTDAIFERMLLLQKKKYAALKVENNGTCTTEIKGLDMVRREYSELSKMASRHVLETILSGEATEIVVSNIHDYLTSLGKEVRDGNVPLDDFVINKQLGKNPEDYPDKKSQPHVQVALRMKAKGGTARRGDVIPYIFCLGDDGSSNTKNAQADRAHHPEDLKRPGSTLRVDYEHYIAMQILPPVERLCGSIEGTERARLAECLGLDASRYAAASVVEREEREFHTLDSQVTDEVRYAQCEEMLFVCKSCKRTSTFEGATKCSSAQGTGQGMLGYSGFVCTHADCSAQLPLATLALQLELRIRAHISAYYMGWNVCTESTCRARTRQLGVYGNERCLVFGCRGSMRQAYSTKSLYTQLRYYEHLFDSESAKTKWVGKSFEADGKLVVDNAQAELSKLKSIVDKYLQKSETRFVDLNKLFSFMKRVPVSHS